MRSVYPVEASADRPFNLQAALLAGILSILVNTAILATADYCHIVTARGGLLTLILRTGLLSSTWANSYQFRQLFHIAVGILMLVVYAGTLARLNVPVIAKGLFTAASVWLVNASIILPAIGQGFAGERIISPSGMELFAAAHTLFFLMGAVLYERWQ
jgi:hypothetical protein